MGSLRELGKIKTFDVIEIWTMRDFFLFKFCFVLLLIYYTTYVNNKKRLEEREKENWLMEIINISETEMAC